MTKFITEFLIPCLDDERFGSRLQWVNRTEGVFQLKWKHKSGPAWTEYDALVFSAWDRMKGRYQPTQKDYFTRSKQRFRALLYKFTQDKQLNRLDSSDRDFQKYCIVNWSCPALEDNMRYVRAERVRAIYSERLWNDEFNHLSDSEEENVNLSAVFKDHIYSAKYQVPQMPDLDDTSASDEMWETNLPSPKFHPICDWVVQDPPIADVHYSFDESPLPELEDSQHLELMPLLESQQG